MGLFGKISNANSIGWLGPPQNRHNTVAVPQRNVGELKNYNGHFQNLLKAKRLRIKSKIVTASCYNKVFNTTLLNRTSRDDCVTTKVGSNKNETLNY